MNRFIFLTLTVAAFGFVACSDPAIVDPGVSSGEDQSSAKQGSSAKVSSSEEGSSADSKSSSSIAPEVTDPEYWNKSLDYDPFVDDRDGESYRTIEIGNQTWLAENLRYTPKVGKSWCYDRKSGNCDTYGRLYDWSAAETACPEGWKLPDTTDWSTLVKNAGGKVSAGTKLKAKKALWGMNKGTDALGFSAIPGGGFDGDAYFDMGVTAIWWTATSVNNTEAFSIDLLGTSAAVRTSKMLKEVGGGIRCILKMSGSNSSSSAQLSSSIAPSSERVSSSVVVSSSSSSNGPDFGIFIDTAKGDTFKTVVIGEQTWFAKNENRELNSYGICYDQLSINCDSLGMLYAGSSPQICPTGTHIPTRAEWQTLIEFEGGTLDTQGKRLKSKSFLWTQEPGTDDFGFSAMPGGYLLQYEFYERSKNAYFWTSSSDGGYGVYVKLSGSSDTVSFHTVASGENPYYSVRCIVDPEK